jgi:hypothetical protein
MRIEDLIIEEEVSRMDEGPIKSMARGAIATAGLIGAMNLPHAEKPGIDISPWKNPNVTTTALELPPADNNVSVAPKTGENWAEHSTAYDSLATGIAKKYRIDKPLAREIVELAYMYEDPIFPKAKDILAIIGTESSFNPNARSKLRRDPAIGLMQVRPNVWGVDHDEMLNSIELQIKIGANVLKRYYARTKDKSNAVQAYNVGITKFKKGKRATAYLAKYTAALNHIESIL